MDSSGIGKSIVADRILQRNRDLSAFSHDLFRGTYWGLLGNYRDLHRQWRHLQGTAGLHPMYIEEITIARDKIGEVIEAYFALHVHTDEASELPSHTIEQLAIARQNGLRQWADDFVNEGY